MLYLVAKSKLDADPTSKVGQHTASAISGLGSAALLPAEIKKKGPDTVKNLLAGQQVQTLSPICYNEVKIRSILFELDYRTRANIGHS